MMNPVAWVRMRRREYTEALWARAEKGAIGYLEETYGCGTFRHLRPSTRERLTEGVAEAFMITARFHGLAPGWRRRWRAND